MKILVVDDSQFAQQMMNRFLKEILEDVELHFASNGAEGYDTYNLVKPDFVLTDLLMPGIDGKTMIKLIKHSNKDAKIIVISSDVQKSVKAEVEELGINMFLNKPLDEEKKSILLGIFNEG